MQIEHSFGYVECFRLRLSGIGKAFLSNAPLDLDPAHLPADRKGSVLIEAGGVCRPVVAQKPNVTDDQVRAVVATYSRSITPLDQLSTEAAGDIYRRRTRWILNGDDISTPIREGGSDMTEANPHDPQDRTASREPDGPSPSNVTRLPIAPRPGAATLPAWHDQTSDAPSLRELAAAARAR